MSSQIIDTAAVANALDDNADAAAIREVILTLANAIQGDFNALEGRLDNFQELLPNTGGLAGIIREIETALGLRDESASAISYCTVQGMARYGFNELAQRTANADELMVLPETLRLYVTGGDVSGLDESEQKKAISAYWAIAQALTESSGEIDQYLGVIYPAPLQVIPRNIRDIACRIARYRLARYESGSEQESRVYRDYVLDVEYLKQVATGKMPVAGLDNTSAVNPAFRGYAVIAPTAIYNKAAFK